MENKMNNKILNETVHIGNDSIDTSSNLHNAGVSYGIRQYYYYKRYDNRIAYQSYDELKFMLEYDLKLKELLFDKILYIEGSFKSITLDCIIKYINSTYLADFCDRAIMRYSDLPNTMSESSRHRIELNGLRLCNRLNTFILSSYEHCNKEIEYYINNGKHKELPLYIVFENLTFGEFCNLLSCLKLDIRKQFSMAVKMTPSYDTNYDLLIRYIYLIKCLRNSIAHNALIFDCRFLDFRLNKIMHYHLKNEFSLPYVNFKHISDYFLLIIYLLKILGKNKKELLMLIDNYAFLVMKYSETLNEDIRKLIQPRDLFIKLDDSINAIINSDGD